MQSDGDDKTLKVLFLAQTPPPIHGVTRVSKQIYDIMNAMANVSVKQMWAGSAVSLDDIGHRSIRKYLAFAIFLMSLGWRVLTTKRDDIVYTTIAPHGEALFRDALVIAVGRLLGHRVLIHMHTRGIGEVISGTTLSQRFTAWALKSTELISQSSDVINEVSKFGLFSRIHHLPNYVADPGTPESTGRETLNLGFFGSFDQRKGVLRFVDVVAALKNDGLEVRGYIAGRSTQDMTPEVIANYATKHGVCEQLAIPGFLLDDQAIKCFLRQLDLFIYPTDHDLAPLVLLEAMANGVVPLAFDTGAIREMLSPEFTDHVIANSLDPETYTSQYLAHIKRYNDDRKLLNDDKKKARDTFLARHSLENFERTFRNIIANPIFNNPKDPAARSEFAKFYS